MGSFRQDPERALQLARMRRVERCHHRADRAEANAAEMADLAKLWRDLAQELELEHSASRGPVRPLREGEQQAVLRANLRLVQRRLSARIANFSLWRPDFALGVLVGVLGMAALLVPRWIEEISGIDIDRSSGVLESTAVILLPLAAIGGAAAWRICRRLIALRDD
jgi:hypothetical protein